MQRIIILYLVVFLSACVSNKPKIVPDAGFNGIWEGTGTQSGSDAWTIKISINGGRYEIDYPSRNCGGKLIPIAASENSVGFKENITGGDSACISDGVVSLTRADDGNIRYNWFHPDIQHGAVATLVDSRNIAAVSAQAETTTKTKKKSSTLVLQGSAASKPNKENTPEIDYNNIPAYNGFSIFAPYYAEQPQHCTERMVYNIVPSNVGDTIVALNGGDTIVALNGGDTRPYDPVVDTAAQYFGQYIAQSCQKLYALRLSYKTTELPYKTAYGMPVGPTITQKGYTYLKKYNWHSESGVRRLRREYKTRPKPGPDTPNPLAKWGFYASDFIAQYGSVTLYAGYSSERMYYNPLTIMVHKVQDNDAIMPVEVNGRRITMDQIFKAQVQAWLAQSDLSLIILGTDPEYIFHYIDGYHTGASVVDTDGPLSGHAGIEIPAVISRSSYNTVYIVRITKASSGEMVGADRIDISNNPGEVTQRKSITLKDVKRLHGRD